MEGERGKERGEGERGGRGGREERGGRREGEERSEEGEGGGGGGRERESGRGQGKEEGETPVQCGTRSLIRKPQNHTFIVMASHDITATSRGSQLIPLKPFK